MDLVAGGTAWGKLRGEVGSQATLLHQMIHPSCLDWKKSTVTGEEGVATLRERDIAAAELGAGAVLRTLPLPSPCHVVRSC